MNKNDKKKLSREEIRKLQEEKKKKVSGNELIKK